MRILISGINYAPESTGTGKYTTEMASWLADRGHEVQIVTAPPHYPEWRVREGYAAWRYAREHVNSVEVLRTPIALLGRGRVSTAKRLMLETSFTLTAARWWVPQLVSRHPPDVVIAICPPLQAAFWPRLLHVTRGVPWVLHVQDLQVDAALRLGMIEASAFANVLYALEERTLRAASYVSTISEAMQRRIHAKGVSPSRTLLFPNWTDLATIAPRPPDPAMRARLGAHADDTLVICSGNVGRKQGLDLVLDAANALRHTRDIRFAIVGNGASRDELEAHAARMDLDNVTFHDFVPSEELPALLAAADIHLVVQKREAADLVMPSKLTNILAAGRPSIATAEPGTDLHAVYETGQVGRTVPPGDAKALATAIADLAVDAPSRSFFGSKARQYAELHLDGQAILTRFESHLAAIALGGHGV